MSEKKKNKEEPVRVQTDRPQVRGWGFTFKTGKTTRSYFHEQIIERLFELNTNTSKTNNMKKITRLLEQLEEHNGKLSDVERESMTYHGRFTRILKIYKEDGLDELVRRDMIRKIDELVDHVNELSHSLRSKADKQTVLGPSPSKAEPKSFTDHLSPVHFNEYEIKPNLLKDAYNAKSSKNQKITAKKTNMINYINSLLSYKKHTILTGPGGSGKSFTARAIAMPMGADRAIYVSAAPLIDNPEVLQDIKNPLGVSLIVIGEIFELGQIRHIYSINAAGIPLVFMTNNPVTQEDADQMGDDLIVMQCTYHLSWQKPEPSAPLA